MASTTLGPRTLKKITELAKKSEDKKALDQLNLNVRTAFIDLEKWSDNRGIVFTPDQGKDIEDLVADVFSDLKVSHQIINGGLTASEAGRANEIVYVKLGKKEGKYVTFTVSIRLISEEVGYTAIYWR